MMKTVLEVMIFVLVIPPIYWISMAIGLWMFDRNNYPKIKSSLKVPIKEQKEEPAPDFEDFEIPTPAVTFNGKDYLIERDGTWHYEVREEETLEEMIAKGYIKAGGIKIILEPEVMEFPMIGARGTVKRELSHGTYRIERDDED